MSLDQTTSRPKFTPGPWEMTYDTVSDVFYISPIEATLPVDPIDGVDVNPDTFAIEQRANAVLMTAAPDLYTALQELVDGPCATFDVEYLPLMRRVMAALNKATEVPA